ncbi:MAG: hypothetical protein ABIR55_19730 [Burkholderiaceae bacterium]
MKHLALAIVACAGCAASAQELGQVVSSTPVIGQVAVPQQFCNQDTVVIPGRSSGGGAALGAITGAVIGSALGHGGGRGAGAVIGMVGGAVIGDQLDGRSADQLQQVRRCTTHTTFENRVLYYDVVYAYAGRQYAAQMPSDPGTTVQVQVTPVASIATAPAPIAMAAPMPMASTITTVESSVEYVPYLAPVRSAPFVIVVPSVGWGYRPPQYHYGARANPIYSRGRGYGQGPYWRESGRRH